MNVGLIGCGRVAEVHMCAFKYIPEVHVTAVSDVNLERANAFARNHAIDKTFNNYLDLLEMKDLDFVDICTPIFNHAEIALETAKAGHNILVEKPMARRTSDCDRIIQEVSKNRVKMCICHNQLYLPQVMRAKTMIDSGELTPTHFRISVNESAELIGAPNWVMTPENGGVLWETGTHCAYLQLAFLKHIDEVYATGHKVKHSVHDHFMAVIHTSEQSLGIIEVSWLAKKVEVVFDLMGSDGRRIQILDYDHFFEPPERSNPVLIFVFGISETVISGELFE